MVYTDISPDVVEHDANNDGELWSYDEREVYRGSMDPHYFEHGLNVYWLYDDNLKRVGLAEHDSETHEVHKALWFNENPFITLYQDPRWKSKNSTLWSMLSNEAYQDCLEDNFTTIHDKALNSGKCLVTPEMLASKNYIYTCSHGTHSKNPHCDASKKYLDYSLFLMLYVDESFVLYEPPSDFTLPQQPDASELEPLEQPASPPDLPAS